jgi:hypothetical protein
MPSVSGPIILSLVYRQRRGLFHKKEIYDHNILIWCVLVPVLGPVAPSTVHYIIPYHNGRIVTVEKREVTMRLIETQNLWVP